MRRTTLSWMYQRDTKLEKVAFDAMLAFLVAACPPMMLTDTPEGSSLFRFVASVPV